MPNYSPNDLILMITTNNLAGVYARLLHEGLVSGTMVPSVEAISYTVQEQARRLSTPEFLAWLERAFDVPADLNRPYAIELRTIALETGRTPARLMVEKFTESLAETGITAQANNRSAGIVPTIPAGYAVPTWLSWLVLGLALIGLVFLGRAVFRWIATHHS